MTDRYKIFATRYNDFLLSIRSTIDFVKISYLRVHKNARVHSGRYGNERYVKGFIEADTL